MLLWDLTQFMHFIYFIWGAFPAVCRDLGCQPFLSIINQLVFSTRAWGCDVAWGPLWYTGCAFLLKFCDARTTRDSPVMLEYHRITPENFEGHVVQGIGGGAYASLLLSKFLGSVIYNWTSMIYQEISKQDNVFFII